MKRIHLQVSDKMLKSLDAKIKDQGYADRSEWIREQIRRFLSK